MNVVVDANLSPRWVAVLMEAGHQAVHWSEVGRLNASDAQGPSVIQLRAQDVLPEHLAELVLDVLVDQASALNLGAIVSLDVRSARIRVLPLMS